MNRKLCKHNIPGIVKALNNTFHYMFIGHDEEACFDRDIIFLLKIGMKTLSWEVLRRG